MKAKVFIGLLALVVSAVYALELESIAVYRDVDGNLTHASEIGLKKLAKEARRSGHISIWVTFDMDFVGIPELRTAEVEQAEAAVKAAMIEDVIDPIGNDAVLLTIPAGLESAPGVLVDVTESGLISIVENNKVKHVSYFP